MEGVASRLSCLARRGVLARACGVSGAGWHQGVPAAQDSCGAAGGHTGYSRCFASVSASAGGAPDDTLAALTGRVAPPQGMPAFCSAGEPAPVACTSIEDLVPIFLSPPQLGAQLLESVHAATGLPWWASIPAATVAVRAALTPLSLKAYASSSKIALLHRAVGLSRHVADAVAAMGSGGQSSSKESETKEPGGGGGSKLQLSRLDLVRRVLECLQASHRAPSFAWYLANAAVQVPVAVTLTLALRRMSDSVWPGLATEGALYFTDLTAPPVYLQTLSTPYGTAGAILPLGIILMYGSAMDRSAGGSSPGISAAMKLLMVPLYCAALLQPHAVLLYWATLSVTQLGLYAAVQRVPALGGAKEPSKDAGKDVALEDVLLAVAESYERSGNRAAACACLKALLARRPEDEAVQGRLQELSS